MGVVVIFKYFASLHFKEEKKKESKIKLYTVQSISSLSCGMGPFSSQPRHSAPPTKPPPLTMRRAAACHRNAHSPRINLNKKVL